MIPRMVCVEVLLLYYTYYLSFAMIICFRFPPPSVILMADVRGEPGPLFILGVFVLATKSGSLMVFELILLRVRSELIN